MTRYQVDSDLVMGTTARVRGSIDTIQSEVAGLMRQLTELQGTWTGEASVAFQSVVSDWRATQQRVEESISTINHALGRAGTQYQEVERGNADLFRMG
ncbi:WXG100 family type VII secretion target [Okibacterium sp. HSC-33S16]|uniref:WXG100 family type VII secretion target n=1 Tax=Okibacterium sp. HSC-33S16 TaxID=2910965 RepID=UPI00209EB00E|nr:WXG100 family type VII secretion target [Okibacterium sp. HSC-33S16]MCP2030176.1 WXG100 family type VII secretion target [Okibacterium sp. HSC-33S16]